MSTSRLSQMGWLELSAPILSFLVISPLVIIALSIFATDSIQILAHLWNTVLDAYVINSLLLLAGVGLLILIIGVPTAWLTSVCEFPGRKIFQWALLLPLAFPAYIIAYTYTGILDYAGPVFTLLRELIGRPLADQLYFPIRSVPGATAMLALVLYPYVYLLTRVAFLEQSVRAIEVSRTLGYSIRQGFFRLAIPLARPAIVTGVSLALMETLADYGTVQYFGISTFTTGIFRAFYGMDSLTAASQLATVLMLFVAFLIFCERYSRRRARYDANKKYSTHGLRIQLVGKQVAAAWLTCAIPILLGFVIPALILLKWTLFDATWQFATFADLVWNSFFLAFLAAVIAVIFSTILCYAKRRSKDRFIHGVINISGLGYAIPGTIIAIAVISPLVWIDHQLINIFGLFSDYEFGLILSGSIFALLFAYTARFIAISSGSIQSGLEKITPNMDYSARTLGYKPSEVLRLVHVPLIRSSLLTAFLIVFVDVLKELPATLILRPFNFNTLAVRAFELASDERLVDAALPSLMIILTGIIPVIFLSRSISQRRNEVT